MQIRKYDGPIWYCARIVSFSLLFFAVSNLLTLLLLTLLRLHDFSRSLACSWVLPF